MIGFWDTSFPFQSDDPEVKATIYEHTDHLIIALGNFSRDPKDIVLKNRPGSVYNLDGEELIAPAIQDFQDSAVFKSGEKRSDSHAEILGNSFAAL